MILKRKNNKNKKGANKIAPNPKERSQSPKPFAAMSHALLSDANDSKKTSDNKTAMRPKIITTFRVGKNFIKMRAAWNDFRTANMLEIIDDPEYTLQQMNKFLQI